MPSHHVKLPIPSIGSLIRLTGSGFDRPYHGIFLGLREGRMLLDVDPYNLLPDDMKYELVPTTVKYERV